MDKKEQKFFDIAKDSAEEFLQDKDKSKLLLEEALDKAEKNKDRIRDFLEDLQTLYRMLRAWFTGLYDFSGTVLMMIIAAILYFVMPVDAIPDFIPGLGYVDDAAVIAYVINAIKEEIDSFREWESTQS